MKLIDKRELMELLDDMFSRYDGTPSVMEGFKYGIDAVISEVSVMPTIDAEPVKHGKWIVDGEDWRKQIEWFKCSLCDFPTSTLAYKYCPCCGARMEGVGE